MCEFITAGGLNRADLPPTLAREGLMMRDALLHDLSMIPDVEVITTHDARLSSPLLSSIPIGAQDDRLFIWQSALQNCDAAFIIAPETGGQLAELVELVNHCKIVHLGSSLNAIKVAGSKYQTFQLLTKAGLNVVPTYYLNEFSALVSKDDSQKWVVKPDDGVGCEGAIVFINQMEAERYLLHQIGISVIQPYVSGISASISMLCLNGEAWVLSCNLQKVILVDSRFFYRGSVVNGLPLNYVRFTKVAAQIAQAMPELAGYVGVDVILNEDNITILEINPRLTTSFVGLNQSLGINPTRLIVDLFFEPQFTMQELYKLNKLIKLNNTPVEFTV